MAEFFDFPGAKRFYLVNEDRMPHSRLTLLYDLSASMTYAGFISYV